MRSLFLTTLLLTSVTFAASKWPSAPTEVSHPGSQQYPYSLLKEKKSVAGREVVYYGPAEAKNQSKKIPMVVFGHGQAIGPEGYEATFVHLARKGVAACYVQYDTGFFDQNWHRMADDFNRLAQDCATRHQEVVDPRWVVYAGHSKGAYVALMALGTTQLARSAVFFSPAGIDEELLQKINPTIPVTLIWGEADTVIKKDLISEIFQKLPVQKKQFLLVKNYPADLDLTAEHFFTLNKKYFFGGRDGLTPYHYHGSWKWLMGAALDLQDGDRLTNSYLYGDEALTSGASGTQHSVSRSW